MGSVFGLDARTGELLWSFSPELERGAGAIEGFVSRGLAHVHTPSQGSDDFRCPERLIGTLPDGRLFAISPETGTVCADFGASGFVFIADPQMEGLTSPPVAVDSLVVVGTAMSGLFAPSGRAGTVRAIHVRHGRLMWVTSVPELRSLCVFPDCDELVIPRSPAGGNAWSPLEASEELGLVFAAIASLSPTYLPRGDQGFHSGVLALTADSGHVVWRRSLLPLDVWDYDATALALVPRRRSDPSEGLDLLVGIKVGGLFRFDASTGAWRTPRVAAAIGQDREAGRALTAEFPVWGGDTLRPGRLTMDSIGTSNAQHAHWCQDTWAGLDHTGPFAEPGFGARLHWPGHYGGISWDGVATDDEGAIAVVAIKRIASIVSLEPSAAQGPDTMGPGGSARGDRRLFVDPSGRPCTPPPFTEWIALDLGGDSVLWRSSLTENLDSPFGNAAFGGAAISSGGVLFTAATAEPVLRGYRAMDGASVWSHALPATGNTVPITAHVDGEEFVFLVAGGRGGFGIPGEWVMAFAIGPP